MICCIPLFCSIKKQEGKFSDTLDTESEDSGLAVGEGKWYAQSRKRRNEIKTEGLQRLSLLNLTYQGRWARASPATCKALEEEGGAGREVCARDSNQEASPQPKRRHKLCLGMKQFLLCMAMKQLDFIRSCKAEPYWTLGTTDSNANVTMNAYQGSCQKPLVWCKDKHYTGCINLTSPPRVDMLTEDAPQGS